MTGDSQVSTLHACSLSNFSSFFLKNKKVCVFMYICVYDLCIVLAEEGNNAVLGLYSPLD